MKLNKMHMDVLFFVFIFTFLYLFKMSETAFKIKTPEQSLIFTRTLDTNFATEKIFHKT